MNRKTIGSIEELMDEYQLQMDTGKDVDPEQFVRSWPQYRSEFLDAVRHQASGNSDPPVSSQTILETNPPPVFPSQIGPYRILGQLGRGGMSIVYKACRDDSDQEVALKVIDPAIAGDQDVYRRFRREAEIVQRLDHQHVVSLIEVGEVADRPYLAMDLIDGPSLAGLIASLREQADDQVLSSSATKVFPADDSELQGSSTWTRPVNVHSNQMENCRLADKLNNAEFVTIACMMADVAEALHSAHLLGIVHRDVKPSNLLLDRAGKIWLADFGLALLSEGQTLLTQTGKVVGTPHYMSPEQTSGQRMVDHRTDIYSLGATVYEFAARNRPYAGDRQQVWREISDGRLTHPSRIRASIPRQLESIILKSMAHVPSDRYATAADMASDLRRFAAGKAIKARRPGIAEHAIRWVVRNPRRTMLTAIVLSSIVLGVIAFQHIGGRRLEAMNEKLASINAVLERTNSDLDHSRELLQRNLYVADMASAYRAYALQDIDEVHQLLDRQLPQGDEVDLRGFEWWLLDRLSRPPTVTQLVGHQGPVYEATVVLQSKHLLSVGEDGTSRLWDIDTGQQLRQFEVGQRMNAIAVSSDSANYLTGVNHPDGDNPLSFGSLRTGETTRIPSTHDSSIESVAISPDGRFLASAGRYGDVAIHDVDGNQLHRWATDSRNESLQFSPDGKQLLTVHRTINDIGKFGHARVWDVPGFEKWFDLDVDFNVYSLDVSGNGERVVLAGDDTVALVDLPNRKSIAVQNEVRGRVRDIAISDDGRFIAAACDNGAVHVWDAPIDARNGESGFPPSRTIVDGDDRATSVVFCDSHRVAATRESGQVQVWDLSTQNCPRLMQPAYVTESIREIDSNQVLVRLETGDIARIDIATGASTLVSQVQADYFNCAVATKDGDVIVASNPTGFVVIDANSGDQITDFPGTTEESCRKLAFSTDESRLLALYAYQLCVFDTSDWSIVHTIPVVGDAVRVECSAHRGEYLITGRERMTVIDGETMEPIWDSGQKLGSNSVAAYAPGGQSIIAGQTDGTIEVLDAIDGSRISSLKGHRLSVSDLVFSADGDTLVSSGYDGTIRFWDWKSGREMGTLDMQVGPVSRYIMSSGGRFLVAFGSDGNSIWSIDD
ncbi:Serine/threonine-protein kinase PrkC [Rubripirellula lacrimiformis]|uniref:Serine/threonine-protein kinase PrkC n=1 Tax=Rubripirellula lacrimiformis TaxID=1930273 RepID=A0A517NC47_9BACT|nr:serine/threonine-protein kinase [Rubripirellula lacrimiformis]QDT04707.1 Serine/threonine-protein kinase PrkC [Rubripirellula lacrimiformis]